MGSDRPIRESPVERPRTRRIRDLNPGSVSIKTEDMLGSGEACLWFNPTSQMLVNRSLQKLCENLLQVLGASRMSRIHSSKDNRSDNQFQLKQKKGRPSRD